MAGVRGTISVGLNLVQTGVAGLGTPKLPVAIEEAMTLASGTAAADQANVFYQGLARPLAASATENLDLIGVLTDAFGAVINAAEVVAIYVKAASTNVNSVVVGNVTNGFVGPLGATGSYTIKPGEYYLAISQSGWGVTAATADLLKITNGGGGSAVAYDIVIVGRTVAA